MRFYNSILSPGSLWVCISYGYVIDYVSTFIYNSCDFIKPVIHNTNSLVAPPPPLFFFKLLISYL